MLTTMQIIRGTVIKGLREGAKLGFHTANLNLSLDSSWPPFGVYASWTTINHRKFQSVTHAGPRIMFGIS